MTIGDEKIGMDREKIILEQQKRIEYLRHPDPNDKRVKFLRLFFKILGIIILLLLAILIFLGYRNHIFDSAENFDKFIKGLGMWGPVAFISIQAVQIIIPVLPAPVCCIAGVVSYGPWIGFLYNYIGITLGSFLAFGISRKYGSILAKSVVSDDTYEKYKKWLEHGEKKFDRLFAIAILLPAAPDDFLCYLAGLTKMPFKKFMLIILIGKPFSLLSYSFGLEAFSAFKVKLFNMWRHR